MTARFSGFKFSVCLSIWNKDYTKSSIFNLKPWPVSTPLSRVWRKSPSVKQKPAGYNWVLGFCDGVACRDGRGAKETKRRVPSLGQAAFLGDITSFHLHGVIREMSSSPLYWWGNGSTELWTCPTTWNWYMEKPDWIWACLATCWGVTPPSLSRHLRILFIP